MGSRTLDITVVSASDLKNAGMFSKMNVYAVVTIFGESQTTSVARDCGVKPTWNHQMRFNINEAAAMQNNITIVFSIKSTGGCFGNPDLGEVFVPLKEMLLKGNGDDEKPMSYNITTPGGRAKGVLNISYKFGPSSSANNNAYQSNDNPGTAYAPQPPPPLPQDYTNPTAYPAPQKDGYPPQLDANKAAVAYPAPGYPPQPQAYPLPGGYPPPGYASGAPAPPHPGGYAPVQGPGGMNYPPPPPGSTMGPARYAYAAPPAPAPAPAPQQQNKNSNNSIKKKGMAAGLGLGMGAGLLGGLAGGLALAAAGRGGGLNFGDYGGGDGYGGEDYGGDSD